MSKQMRDLNAKPSSTTSLAMKFQQHNAIIFPFLFHP
jgi:hypothetical protein